jgi:cyclophilin family peptidyl-prolyl cis-trans isomerase
VPTDKRARQRAGREARLAAEAKAHRRRRLLRNAAIIVVAVAAVGGIAYAISQSGGGSSSASSTTTSSSTAPTTTSTTAPTTTTSAATAQNAALQAQANQAAVAAGCPASTSTRVNTLSWPSAPAMTIDPTKTYTANVQTTAGNFTITLDAKKAPKTVNNFVFLAQHGFYKCVIFHRVIPGFMDQTGDPTGTGTGGPGYKFANENLPPSYAPYDVAMANSGPNTNGSQFFIVAPGGQSQLQSDYSLFGTVTSGQDVVSKINQQGSAQGVPPDVTERMLSVTINES